MCLTNSRNIDLWHAGQFTDAHSPVTCHAASGISITTDQKNDLSSVRSASKKPRGKGALLERNRVLTEWF